jgi:uncharacterized SAM-binding protein YcdF (DUF218 family)
VTPQLEFTTLLFNQQPRWPADAMVVLCGEDGEARISDVPRLLMTGAAPLVVLSGGRSQPPRILAAEALREMLIEQGVSDRVMLVEPDSMNTRDQAVNVVALARTHGWSRLLLIASAYHMTRAHLTFLRALTEAGLHDAVHIVPVPVKAPAAPWFGCPAGLAAPRIELLAFEAAKLSQYVDDVATWQEGLDYLQRWEGA